MLTFTFRLPSLFLSAPHKPASLGSPLCKRLCTWIWAWNIFYRMAMGLLARECFDSAVVPEKATWRSRIVMRYYFFSCSSLITYLRSAMSVRAILVFLSSRRSFKKEEREVVVSWVHLLLLFKSCFLPSPSSLHLHILPSSSVAPSVLHDNPFLIQDDHLRRHFLAAGPLH